MIKNKALKQNKSKFYQECASCQKKYTDNKYRRSCECGGLLIYKYNKISKNFVDKKYKNSVWRFHQLLPIENTDNIIDTHVYKTPLIKSSYIAKKLGIKNLYIKDEGQNPSGTFKDREAFITASRLRELGIDELVTATTGDSGLAYARAAFFSGIKVYVFVPNNCRARWESMLEELKTKGEFTESLLRVYYKGEVFSEAIEAASKFAKENRLPIEYGFYNQLRIEGMKTIGFEILEDLGRVPDWYIQAVGSGVGPFAFHKACMEIFAKKPKIAGIQPNGCSPMVNAYRGDEKIEIKNIDTYVTGISNPKLYMSYSHLLGINAIFQEAYAGGKESEKKEIPKLIDMYRRDRVDNPGMEAVTALSGLIQLLKKGKIKQDETIVLCCSGKMRKDLE